MNTPTQTLEIYQEIVQKIIDGTATTEEIKIAEELVIHAVTEINETLTKPTA